MKNTLLTLLLVISLQAFSQMDTYTTKNDTLIIQPIFHGTLAITYNDITIYIDPYGGAEKFTEIKKPDFILITDIHGDHLNLETLNALDTQNSQIVVPRAVAKKLPEQYNNKVKEINNGENISFRGGLEIIALPMYNLPESDDSRHPKGRGNGYIINFGEKKIYISGDTEDIPEMRDLKDIDIAFICMNLPYTMTVEQAASAVLDFKPKVVYPYHYRGKPNFSDIEKFKELVNSKKKSIDVRIRDWYKE